jgi:3-oxoadipate enol-lactonase
MSYTDSIKMYYEDQGSGEPLVCISGIGATHDSWTPVRMILGERYRIITFDNRGIGQTDTTQGPYSIEQMADDTAALMDQLGLPSAHIAGQSMGSAIAQMLAVRHPQKVRKLILCNAFARTRETALFAFRTNVRLLREGVPGPMVFEVILPWLFSDAFFKDEARVNAMLEQVRSQPLPQSVEAFEWQLDAIAAFDSIDVLKMIQTPTLVISGAHDIMTPAKDAQAMAQLIPQAIYREIPTGHLSIVEDPAAVATLIGEFLAMNR